MPPRRRKLGRRIFRGLTTTSLVLALVVMFLWMRSILSHSDELSINTNIEPVARNAGLVIFTSENGHLGLERLDFRDSKTGERTFYCEGMWFRSEFWKVGDAGGTAWWPPISWRYQLINGGSLGWQWKVTISDWLLLLLLSIAPLARYVIHCRNLARIGLCDSCGYDLRASIGQCPECGEPIPEKSAKIASSSPNLP